MAILKLFAVSAMAVLFLAGCEPTSNATTTKPSGPAASGLTVERAQGELTTFLIERSKAEIYAAGCFRQGVGLRETSRDIALIRFFAQMRARGYTEAQLQAASKAITPSAALGQRAVNDMIAMGVRKGDTASLCNAAQKEIASRTLTGSMIYNR